MPGDEKGENLYNIPYVLYVGERWGYKNFETLVKYLAPIVKRHKELYVVCTGKKFASVEISLMESMGIKDRFIHHWVSTNNELYSLYNNAVCFVYPSEYEGFGIPILEAYQADCFP